MSIGAAIGGLSSIGGGLFSALGADQRAQQQQQQDLEQQQADLFNAAIAQRNETYVKEALPLQLEQQQRTNEAQLGTIRATYGASGLDATGSVLDTLAGTARAQAFNTQLTKFQSHIQQQEYEDEANIQYQNASIEGQQASQAGQSGFLGILGAAFGAGTSLTNNSAVRSSLGFG